MAKKKKFPADEPQYWRSMPLTTIDQHPFIEMNEVDWHNLEEWHRHSRPKQAVRLTSHQRHSPLPEPLSFMRRARHHTTRGRNKAERLMDRYWFVRVPDSTDYKELAYSKAIPGRKTIIYPPFLPKGRAPKKIYSERSCRYCGEPFKAKRADALFCKPKCRQAAKRKRKADVTDN